MYCNQTIRDCFEYLALCESPLAPNVSRVSLLGLELLDIILRLLLVHVAIPSTDFYYYVADILKEEHIVF